MYWEGTRRTRRGSKVICLLKQYFAQFWRLPDYFSEPCLCKTLRSREELGICITTSQTTTAHEHTLNQLLQFYNLHTTQLIHSHHNHYYRFAKFLLVLELQLVLSWFLCTIGSSRCVMHCTHSPLSIWQVLYSVSYAHLISTISISTFEIYQIIRLQ